MEDQINLTESVTVNKWNDLESLHALMAQYSRGVKYVSWNVRKFPKHFYLRVGWTNRPVSAETTIQPDEDPRPALERLFNEFWSKQ